MKARDKIIQAKSDIILSHPFFAYLNCKLEYVEDLTCPTMWTNGKKIGYNPEYIDTLNLGKTIFGIAHEVMHDADGHFWRRGNRDPRLFNIAGDYAINPQIIAAGVGEPPEGILVDARFNGMPVEKIYDILKREEDESGEQQENNGPGEVRDCQEDAKEEQAVEWQQSVLNAAKIAQAQGQMPKGLERLLDSIREPQVDWRSALRRFFEQNAKNDFSWRQPNPKYISMGLYLPSLHSEQLPSVVIVVDTSGSISDGVLTQFAGEITSIMDETKPEHLHVIYCDAKVHAVEEYEPGATIKFNPKGRGGTSFKPPFDYLAEKGINPACLIYLTDLEGDFPDPPDFPTLWCATTKHQAPFGEVLRINEWN